MANQTRVHPDTSRQREMDKLADDDAKASQAAGSDHITVEDVDAWLDEIDEALGAEVQFAETFWATFVQKSGE
jgi:ubiquitin-like protein Pup